MGRIIEIKDLSDPALDLFARLTESQLRNRLEPEKGVFIAESAKVIDVALERGHVPTAFLMDRRHIQGAGARFMELCPDTPVYTAEGAVLEKLTGYRLNRGMLCAMERPRPKAVEEVCAGARRIAVIEGVTDATNVGAIFRSAAALGMDALLVTPDCCDPLNRRAVRVSMGTVLQVPWAVTGPWPEDMEKLKALGFATAALALTDDSISIDDPRLRSEEKLAVILGTEGDGLAASTVAASDWTVRIPMGNGVDSLNVAAAGAVAFWELRYRK